MTTEIIYHPAIALHDAESNHKAMKNDRIARIAAQVLAVPGVCPVTPDPAPDALFLLAHAAGHINGLVTNAPTQEQQYHRIDGETVMNRHTMLALRLSAGAVCRGVDDVVSGQATNAFCPVYAGHHAAYSKAGGFCFTNPVAIGARYAMSIGVPKVAVLDFDTHSGNGTACILMGDDPTKVFFGETYQPGYPGAFMPQRHVSHVRRHLAASPAEFWAGWNDILKRLEEFSPDLILVSAGFDAHVVDPLGQIGLSDRDYAHLTRRILEITPRVVACLEGGYDVDATGRCAALMVENMVTACNEVQP
jgi:acetoin utilization deacetylase AcuC-like enzyme